MEIDSATDLQQMVDTLCRTREDLQYTKLAVEKLMRKAFREVPNLQKQMKKLAQLEDLSFSQEDCVKDLCRASGESFSNDFLKMSRSQPHRVTRDVEGLVRKCPGVLGLDGLLTVSVNEKRLKDAIELGILDPEILNDLTTSKPHGSARIRLTYKV